jgi:hypothetical protein
MPSGIYQRTEKHSFNKGRKYPNRKKYFKGITIRTKICEYCKKEYTPPYNNYARNRFCSRSCASKGHPPGRLGKPNSEKQKASARARIGPLHPRWIKDRLLLKDDSKDRGGQLHREWSNSVKKRDGWKCRISNLQCRGRLEAHHILSWTRYPNLKYEIKNGITLCHFHHPRKRKDELKMIDYFRELLTKL